jgi:hypothetical protein
MTLAEPIAADGGADCQREGQDETVFHGATVLIV